MSRHERLLRKTALLREKTPGHLRSNLRVKLERLLPGKKFAAVNFTQNQVSQVVQKIQDTTPKRFTTHKIPVGFIVERTA